MTEAANVIQQRSSASFWSRTKGFVNSLDAGTIVAGIIAPLVVLVGATFAVRRIFRRPASDDLNSSSPVPGQYRERRLIELFEIIKSSRSSALDGSAFWNLTGRFEPFKDRDRKMRYLKWRVSMHEQHDEHKLITCDDFSEMISQLLEAETPAVFDQFVDLLDHAAAPTARPAEPTARPAERPSQSRDAPSQSRDAPSLPSQPSLSPQAATKCNVSPQVRVESSAPPGLGRAEQKITLPSRAVVSRPVPAHQPVHTAQTTRVLRAFASPPPTKSRTPPKARDSSQTRPIHAAAAEKSSNLARGPWVSPGTPPRSPLRSGRNPSASPSASPSMRPLKASPSGSRNASPSLVAGNSSPLAAHYTSYRPSRQHSPYKSPGGGSSNKQQPTQCITLQLPSTAAPSDSATELTMSAVIIVDCQPLKVFAGTSQGEVQSSLPAPALRLLQVVEYSLDSPEPVRRYSSSGLTRIDTLVASADTGSLFAIGNNPNGSVVHWSHDSEDAEGDVLPKPCWDEKQSKFVDAAESSGQSGKLTAIWLTPASDVLVVGCSSGIAAGWSLLESRWTRKWGEARNWPVNRVCTDGDYVFVATRRRRPTQWHYHTGELVKEFSGELKEVLVLAVADGNLFSAGRDQQVSMYDIESGELRRTFAGEIGFVDCLAVSGKMLFFGGWDSTVKLCHLGDTTALPTLFEGQKTAIRSVTLVEEEPMSDGPGDKAIELYTVASCSKSSEMFCIQKYRVKVVESDEMEPLVLSANALLDDY